MHSNYSVQIEKFAERHFIKSFAKKHQGHWDVTLKAIVAALERIDMLMTTSRATPICTDNKNNIKIVKMEFRVDGTKESAKTSGNRCIVAWYPKKQTVSILLAYGKPDIASHNETAEWQKMVKENYREYNHLF